MKVELLPSALGSAGSRHQYLTSFLVNDVVAIDAGAVGFFDDLARQRRVRHVFITHSHLDHIASLPLLVEHAHGRTGECITVHGSAPVLECLARDFFNGRVWPDLVRLGEGRPPWFRISPLVDGRTVEIEGLSVTPVPVHHTVPTHGFIVEERDARVVFGGDSGPTDALWSEASRRGNVRVVFLEASFPEALADLARASGHLTPPLFAAEMRKLERGPKYIAIHIKPGHYETVCRELRALDDARIEVALPGSPYEI